MSGDPGSLQAVGSRGCQATDGLFFLQRRHKLPVKSPGLSNQSISGRWRPRMTARHGEHMSRTTLFRSIALLVVCVLLWPIGRADAPGVTTGAISAVVKTAQGAL